jgi:pimeloyl-ACP methyl ester carboxylesterase
VRIFAGLYPHDVAGLVLLDPTQEDLVAWAKAREAETHPARADPRAFRAEDEVDCAPMTFAQAAENRLPNVPVVLITGLGPREVPGFLPSKVRREVERDRSTFYPMKRQFHRAWVESLPQGRLVITEESGHGIPWEEPGLVVRVIREVLDQVRRTNTNTGAEAGAGADQRPGEKR